MMMIRRTETAGALSLRIEYSVFSRKLLCNVSLTETRTASCVVYYTRRRSTNL